jgi:hypothetical protein
MRYPNVVADNNVDSPYLRTLFIAIAVELVRT